MQFIINEKLKGKIERKISRGGATSIKLIIVTLILAFLLLVLGINSLNLSLILNISFPVIMIIDGVLLLLTIASVILLIVYQFKNLSKNPKVRCREILSINEYLLCYSYGNIDRFAYPLNKNTNPSTSDLVNIDLNETIVTYDEKQQQLVFKKGITFCSRIVNGPYSAANIIEEFVMYNYFDPSLADELKSRLNDKFSLI